jgi:hypothetical protein
MLEFTLLGWNSENYNIINLSAPGNLDRVLRACGVQYQRPNVGTLPALLGGSRMF